MMKVPMGVIRQRFRSCEGTLLSSLQIAHRRRVPLAATRGLDPAGVQFLRDRGQAEERRK